MSTMAEAILAACGGRLELPDAGNGTCCYGAANGGKDYCTCWEPVYDLDQQPVQPGGLGMRVKPCGDCAYLKNSPERKGDPGYRGDEGDLEAMVVNGEMFACHQGIRRPVKWVHPSGAEIPGHPAGYEPPIVDGRPYKADGSPADLCAGWAARRLKHLHREAQTS